LTVVLNEETFEYVTYLNYSTDRSNNYLNYVSIYIRYTLTQSVLFAFNIVFNIASTLCTNVKLH